MTTAAAFNRAAAVGALNFRNTGLATDRQIDLIRALVNQGRADTLPCEALPDDVAMLTVGQADAYIALLRGV